jgi:hypothetical protein
MFRSKAPLIAVLLLAMVASPAANAAKLKLNTFTDQSLATIDLPATKLLMATVATDAQGGGAAADALTTTVTIGGSVVAADIAAVCVDYNAVEVACVTNPNPLTNIVVTLTGAQPGGAPFDYRVTLNQSAGGKTIFLRVDGFTATDLNDVIPLPQSTATRDISGGATAPTVGSPSIAFRADPTEADIGGTMTDEGSPAVTDCGAEWGESTGTYPNNIAVALPLTECIVDVPFTVLATGLPSSDTIYYRAWAENGLTGNSGESTFITKPAVTTAAATGETQTEAVLGGTVAIGGGEAVIERGVWLHDAPGATNGTQVSMGSGSGSFSNTVDTLSPGTPYYFVAYAVNVSGETVATDEKSFTTLVGQATVATRAVASITATTAELGGDVTSNGGATVTERGIIWKNNSAEPPTDGIVVPIGSGTGSFFATIGDDEPDPLTTGVEVFVWAYATNSEGTAYSAWQSFTPADEPSVTTDIAAGVTQTEALLGGNVSNNNGAAVTDRGVYYILDPGVATNGTKVSMGSGTGTFSQLVSNLDPGKTYNFEAYATNSSGEGLGGELNFSTLAGLPTVETRLPENLTSTTADLGGNIIANGGAPILEHGVVWNTAGDPENSPLGTELNGPTAGPFPYSFLSGVTYSPTVPEASLIYFQAYATNSVGTAYSAQQSFQYVSGQAKDIVITRVEGQSIVFSWTPGLGEGSLVVIRETATDEVVPLDTYDYLDQPPYPNPHFVDAPELNDGSGTGNFVVYQGSGSNLWITGLTLDTEYTISIYDYTGTAFNVDGPAQWVQFTTNERVHNYDNRASCGTDCHNAHVGFLPRGPELSDVCTAACHMPGGPAENKTGFTTDTAISAAGHPTPSSNPNVDTVDCGSCHELHNPNSYDTTQSTHPITATIDYNKAFLRANVDKYAPNAATPANLHGGDTAQENTDVPKVVDTDGETVLVPADTPNRAIEGGDETTARGYCQVCHTYTKYHRSTGTATGGAPLPDGSTLTAHAAWPLTEGDPRCHDGTSTYDPLEDCGENQVTGTPTLNPAFQTHCGDCHEHNNNFVGSGGDTTCIVCHAPGGQGTSGGLSRPAITTMFDRNSKHITVGSAGVTEPDCLVCHDQTGHSSDKIVGLNDLNGAGGPYDQPNATFSTTATGQGEAFAPHCLHGAR